MLGSQLFSKVFSLSAPKLSHSFPDFLSVRLLGSSHSSRSFGASSVSTDSLFPSLVPSASKTSDSSSSSFDSDDSLPHPAIVLACGEHIGRHPTFLDLYDESPPADRYVKRLSWNGRSLIVKYGRDVGLVEAEVLCRLGTETSLPVPQVFGFDSLNGSTYIYMEDLGGKTLESIWSTLSPHDKKPTLNQLQDVVRTLRKVRAPPSAPVGTCDRSSGRPLSDVFGVEGATTYEGCASSHQLRFGLQNELHRRSDNHTDISAEETRIKVERLLPLSSPVVLTHTQLDPGHIFVDARGNITGLIGWSKAAWLPAWAEKTILARRSSGRDWLDGRNALKMMAEKLCGGAKKAEERRNLLRPIGKPVGGSQRSRCRFVVRGERACAHFCSH
ncbi:phosphotransferase family protein [Rhodotorula paludigena]|uniref:phosphotransferase family protein n=1 Tax=Rhodotorula paludigena TaxID=86838 RepID=UPI00317D533B